MGTGIHGGFPNPKRPSRPRTHHSPSFPVGKAGDVRYNRKKTEDYPLNRDHPQGGPKAKFMEEVLGYTRKDAKKFHKRIASSLVGKQPDKTEVTPYGIKRTYRVRVKGKNKDYGDANLVVVIQKDIGRKTYKLVTVYPDNKE